MRLVLATAPFLLALAACGTQSVSYEKSDGTFDRDAYRTAVIGTCRAGVANNDEVPPADRDQVCGCVADRILTKSDEDLLAQVRERAQDEAAQAAAFAACRPASTGPTIPDDEGPPPEEPPPPPVGGSELPLPLVPGTEPARARANLASYFSADDYPAAALRDGAQGRVAVSLEIGPDGRVANCAVTQSSGSAALDSTTCRIIRSRARYTPARNARGEAVADRIQEATVTWALPSD